MGKPSFEARIQRSDVRYRDSDFRPLISDSWLLMKVWTSESIGGFKRTRGTETSQYPEERTSTETPLVVASERGAGQCRMGGNRNPSGKRNLTGRQSRTGKADVLPSARADT